MRLVLVMSDTQLIIMFVQIVIFRFATALDVMLVVFVAQMPLVDDGGGAHTHTFTEDNFQLD